MLKISSENILILIGGIVGLICGFVYYKFVGCENGCPIKSNPWLMTIYGGIMGGLGTSFIYSFFKSKK